MESATYLNFMCYLFKRYSYTLTRLTEDKLHAKTPKTVTQMDSQWLYTQMGCILQESLVSYLV